MPWMKIDIDAVIRERLPRYYRYIPRPLIAWLEHEVCQNDLNSILGHAEGLEGAAFCRDVLAYLHVDYDVHGADLLPECDNRRVTYVSNHPLGGLDGMALIDMVTRHHGGVEPGFVVNDLLMAVEPLRKVFVPVNKHGRQSRGASSMVEEAFASDRPMIVFPAGLVSRRGKGGKVADLRWRKSFVNLSVASGRDIVPLYFDGVNSRLFYRLAQARERLGLRFNFEMLRLPREVMLSRGKHFDIYVGKRIPVSRLQGGSKANDEALAIRKIVYSLKPGDGD